MAGGAKETLCSLAGLSGQTIPAVFDFCYGLSLSHNIEKIGSH